jgi:hypothetical protein
MFFGRKSEPRYEGKRRPALFQEERRTFLLGLQSFFMRKAENTEKKIALVLPKDTCLFAAFLVGRVRASQNPLSPLRVQVKKRMHLS